jgi:hypothetical protein
MSDVSQAHTLRQRSTSSGSFLIGAARDDRCYPWLRSVHGRYVARPIGRERTYGRRVNASMCSGRTTLKCLWSSVAISVRPCRPASAMRLASVPPSGRLA